MKSYFTAIVFPCLCAVAFGCAARTGSTSDAASQAVSSREENEMRAGIISYDGCAFSLTAPRGWVLDAESGADNGVPVVFYPEGSSWKDSRTVLYATATAKGKEGTRESMIEYDMNKFRADDPDVVITDMPLQSGGRKECIVKSFFGKSPENYEAVAYLDEKEHVVFVVLSARDMKTFESSLPVFSEILSSYAYMGTSRE